MYNLLFCVIMKKNAKYNMNKILKLCVPAYIKRHYEKRM